MKVVSNSGPIMSLAKLGALNLLYELYGQIYIPSAVYYEAVIHGLDSGYSDAYRIKSAILRGRIGVIDVNDGELPDDISKLPLDIGEKQVLYIAVRDKFDLILFDDLLAREESKKLGLSVKGTLGVIVQAYREKNINLDKVEEFIQTIIARDDIWISNELCLRVLNELKK